MKPIQAIPLFSLLFGGLLGTASVRAGTPSLVQRGVCDDFTVPLIEEVRVAGQYAYVAGGAAGILVVDVSDPASPGLVGSLALGTSTLARGVAVEGNQAYLVDWLGGLNVMDLADPTQPVRVGYDGEFKTLIDLEVSGGYAYAADYDVGLRVFDVSDAAAPVQVGLVDTHRANAVGRQGQYVYVAAISHGLVVIDVSDPTQPVQAGQFLDGENHVHEVAVADGHAYVIELDGAAQYATTRLRVLDLTDPAVPVSLASLELAAGYYLAVEGQYLVVGTTEGGLQLVDIADPADPRLLSSYATESGSSGRPVFAGGLVYWPNGGNGLEVLGIAEAPDLAISRSGAQGTLQVEWEQLPGARLQRCDNLANPVWEDVVDGGIEPMTTLPQSGQMGFLRVVRDVF